MFGCRTPYYTILFQSREKSQSIICKNIHLEEKFNNLLEYLRVKSIEDIEPQACGNNRLPSKAAFDVFVFKKWVTDIKKGRKTFYKLNVVGKRNP